MSYHTNQQNLQNVTGKDAPRSLTATAVSSDLNHLSYNRENSNYAPVIVAVTKKKKFGIRPISFREIKKLTTIYESTEENDVSTVNSRYLPI